MSGTRNRRGYCRAICRHPSHATPSQRSPAMSPGAPTPFSSSIGPDGNYDQPRRARQHHAVFLPSRAPELNPVENIWQYLAPTGSPTASSKPTKQSSRQHATPGRAHCRARDHHLNRNAAMGSRRSDNDRWYYVFRLPENSESDGSLVARLCGKAHCRGAARTSLSNQSLVRTRALLIARRKGCRR